MKFILFVEGHTEAKVLPAFLKRWLDPRLDASVGIKPVRFEGWQQLVKDAPLKARMHLNGPGKQDIIAVISLLDLYGPTFYPADKKKAEDRYQWAKKQLEKEVGQAKFFQFFAVHELEAWLLSAPEIFPPELRKSVAACVKPEGVNNTEPPAKLLERLYPLHCRRNYKKVVDGDELFGKLNPELAYDKCPHLKELLDNMLKLAQNHIS